MSGNFSRATMAGWGNVLVSIELILPLSLQLLHEAPLLSATGKNRLSTGPTALLTMPRTSACPVRDRLLESRCGHGSAHRPVGGNPSNTASVPSLRQIGHCSH